MYNEEVSKVAEAAMSKVKFLNVSKSRYLISAMLAGLYVALGMMLIFTIGGILSAANSPATKIVMGTSFGVALSLVLMAGSDLFTGNTFTMAMGYLKKSTSLVDGFKILVFSWIGNLLGSIIGAYAFYAAGLANGKIGDFIKHYAAAKMALHTHEMLVRAILCNILVSLATWFMYKMKGESAKLIMVFWCIFTFITSGFEHSVANMTVFSISLFIPHGADVSFIAAVHNLVVVTIGNFIGGALVLAVPYYLMAKDKVK